MSALRVLVIQPDPSDPPGRLGEWLEQAGGELDIRDPAREAVPASAEGFDALVCLGGGMSVHDVAKHPWLSDVQRLLAEATSRGLPTLAICLGSQLLAAAHGGRVETAEKPEVGPGLVSKRDAAWQDPLLADVPLLPDVLQYHGESIEQLPGKAVLLASASASTHQAFRIGRCAYGFQFHIETTPETVLGWAQQSPEMAAWARPDALDEGTLAELHRDIEEVWQPVVARFAELAAGTIEPAKPPGLPLR